MSRSNCWQSQNVLYRIQIFGENNTKVLSMLQGTAKDLLSDVSMLQGTAKDLLSMYLCKDLKRDYC